MKNSLTKPERLRGENRIGALFEKGRGGVIGPVRFRWLATADGPSAAPGCGRSGGAVEPVGSVFPRPPLGGKPRIALQSDASVSVLFSVPKKFFKRAWRRNLLKRRMRESYRTRKHALCAAAEAAGLHIDIALICGPATPPDAPGVKGAMAAKAAKSTKAAAECAMASKGAKASNRAKVAKGAKTAKAAPTPPDFKTIDDAIEKILAKILGRL